MRVACYDSLGDELGDKVGGSGEENLAERRRFRRFNKVPTLADVSISLNVGQGALATWLAIRRLFMG
ncbi:MAG: hypothetical protein CMJ77_11780 [Planctomycetaceae bacterium]|nr:hypothetical protein [Planctomycetaceae bacterium]